MPTRDFGYSGMIIRFAERDPGIAQDRLGGRGVEEEVRQCEAGEIMRTVKLVAHAVRELDLDLSVFAACQCRGIEALEIRGRARASEAGQSILRKGPKPSDIGREAAACPERGVLP